LASGETIEQGRYQTAFPGDYGMHNLLFFLKIDHKMPFLRFLGMGVNVKSARKQQ
jgi:hypothetical protein